MAAPEKKNSKGKDEKPYSPVDPRIKFLGAYMPPARRDNKDPIIFAATAQDLGLPAKVLADLMNRSKTEDDH